MVLLQRASAARPAVAFHLARERWVELHSQLAATSGSHPGDATCGAVDGRHLVQDLAVVVALRDGALDAGAPAAGVHAAVEGVLGAVHSSLESIVRAVEHSANAGVGAAWSGRMPAWRTQLCCRIPWQGSSQHHRVRVDCYQASLCTSRGKPMAVSRRY